MNLTTEELRKINNALGIELPRESLEEHLNRAYGTSPENINQVIDDITTCQLTMRPGKVFWDILGDTFSYIPNYILGFRSDNYYNLVDLDFLVREYKLDENAINMSDKKIATEEIYTILMTLADNTMVEIARDPNENVDEQWYHEHRFDLLDMASWFVDCMIINSPPLTGGCPKREAFIRYFKDAIRHSFEMSPRL